MLSTLASSTTAGGAEGVPRLHPAWVVLGAVTVCFHLGLIFYGLTPALVSRPIHLALALPWILILAARTPSSAGAAGC